jgi:hypothetical protein
MGAIGSSCNSPHKKYAGAIGTPVATDFTIKIHNFIFYGKRKRMEIIRGRPYGIKGMIDYPSLSWPAVYFDFAINYLCELSSVGFNIIEDQMDH